jgi:hypothetical protein
MVLEKAEHHVLVFYYQGYNMLPVEYVKNFKALVGAMETYGGTYGCKPGLLRAQLIKQGVSNSDLDTPDPIKLKKAEGICRKQYLLYMLLWGVYQSRYSKLKDNLSKDMTKGVDNFPKTMLEMLQLMSTYKVLAMAQHVKENSEGMAFAQEGKVVNAKDYSDIECWHCSKRGHYQSNCPKLKVGGADDGIQNFTIKELDDGHSLFLANEEDECMLVQNKGAESALSPDHLYINTCVNSYPTTPYAHLLDNLMKQQCGLCGYTNSGSTAIDMANDFGAIKKMWPNECGAMSIIPLKVLKMIWPISYHSKKGMNTGHNNHHYYLQVY